MAEKPLVQVSAPKAELRICLLIATESIQPKKEPMYYSRGIQTSPDDDSLEVFDEEIRVEEYSEKPSNIEEEPEIVADNVNSNEELALPEQKDVEVSQSLYFLDDTSTKDRVVSGDNFRSFITKASRIADRALYIGEKYDIFKDNRDNEDNESTYVNSHVTLIHIY